MECTKPHQISHVQEFCRVCYLGVLYRERFCYREPLIFMSCLVFFKKKVYQSEVQTFDTLKYFTSWHGHFSFASFLKMSFHSQILLLYFYGFLNSALSSTLMSELGFVSLFRCALPVNLTMEIHF